MKKVFVLLCLSTFFYACTDTEGYESISLAHPETNMRVNAYTVDCLGEMAGKCLLVQEGDKIGSEQWDYFYYENSIAGFQFEPGYRYDLIVKKTAVENPPQDGSTIIYELVKLVSKEKQD